MRTPVKDEVIRLQGVISNYSGMVPLYKLDNYGAENLMKLGYELEEESFIASPGSRRELLNRAVIATLCLADEIGGDELLKTQTAYLCSRARLIAAAVERDDPNQASLELPLLEYIAILRAELLSTPLETSIPAAAALVRRELADLGHAGAGQLEQRAMMAAGIGNLMDLLMAETIGEALSAGIKTERKGGMAM